MKIRTNGAMAKRTNDTLITWQFTDGEELSFDATRTTKDIREEAMMHGFGQKIGDAAALSTGEDGKSATVAAKRAAMGEVIESLYAGNWDRKREGDGGILFLALQRLYKGKKSDKKLKAYLAGLSKGQQTALAYTDKVKPHVDAIRKERNRDVDTKGMFDELDKI